MISRHVLGSVGRIEGNSFGAVDEGTVDLDALTFVNFWLRLVGRESSGLTRTRFVPAGAGILRR